MSQSERSTQEIAIGTVIAGRYKVVSVLGHGGFGVVYLVEMVGAMAGAQLALKLIRDLGGDAKAKERFVREVRLAMGVVHKYIVQIRDVGETETGDLYYTMDYCPGESLASILKREVKLSPQRSLRIALRILTGLRAAHRHGVIHRDLKPGNVMVFQRKGHETVLILDFGLAMALGGIDQGAYRGGSLHYMAPEQYLHGEMGFYTDVYSVGVILYRCLTGQTPFQGRTPGEVYEDQMRREAIPPHEICPEVSLYAGLSEAVCRSIQREPAERYRDVTEFFLDLKRALGGDAEDPEGRWEDQPAGPSLPDARPAAYQPVFPHTVESRPMEQHPVDHRPSDHRPENPHPGGHHPHRHPVHRRIRPRRPSAVLFAICAVVFGVLLGFIIMFLMSPPTQETGAGGRSGEKGPPAGQQPEKPPQAPSGSTRKKTAAEKPTQPRSEKSAQGEEQEPLVAKVEPSPETGQAQSVAQVGRNATLLAEARAAFESGRYDEANAKCGEVLAAEPGNGEALEIKGRAALKLRLHREALGCLARLVDDIRLEGREVGPELWLLVVEATVGLKDPGGEDDTLRGKAVLALVSQADASWSWKVARLLDARPRREGDEAIQQENEVMGILARLKGAPVEDPEYPAFEKKYADLRLERERAASALLKRARDAASRGDEDGLAEAVRQAHRLKPPAEEGAPLSRAFVELADIQIRFHIEMQKPEAARAKLDELKAEALDDEASARVAVLEARIELPGFADPAPSDAQVERLLQRLDAAVNAWGRDPVSEGGAKRNAAPAGSSARGGAGALAQEVATYQVRCCALLGDSRRLQTELDKARIPDDPTLLFHQAESLYILSDKLSDTKVTASHLNLALKRLDSVRGKGASDRFPSFHYLMGLCHLGLAGRSATDKARVDCYSKAKKSFADAAKRNEKDPRCFLRHGEALFGLGEITMSRDSYSQAADKSLAAFRLDPTVEAAHQAARGFYRAGRAREARDAVSAGLAAHPNSSRLAALRGLLDAVPRPLLLPTAEEGGYRWRYTTAAPDADQWHQPSFVDQSWLEGRSGFGSGAVPTANFNTEWEASKGEIWLRARFWATRADADCRVHLRRMHLGNCRVWLNGKLLEYAPGATNGYEPYSVTIQIHLLEGLNVIAVHSRSESSNRFVDFGVVALP